MIMPVMLPRQGIFLVWGKDGVVLKQLLFIVHS